MDWALLVSQWLLIVIGVQAIRSFGKWTASNAALIERHEAIVHRLETLQATTDTAVNHAAPFVYEDPDARSA